MRKRREKKVGAEYHLAALINRQEFIFADTVIKSLFLATLRRAKLKYSFIIRNFCIMNNHVHLMLKPLENTDLSRLMQWVLSVFAKAYNKHQGYKGHVFYDRFKSVIIKDKRQLHATIMYIWKNPESMRDVLDIRDYRFSGFYCIKIGRYDIIDPPDKDTLLCFDKMNTAA